MDPVLDKKFVRLEAKKGSLPLIKIRPYTLQKLQGLDEARLSGRRDDAEWVCALHCVNVKDRTNMRGMC